MQINFEKSITNKFQPFFAYLNPKQQMFFLTKIALKLSITSKHVRFLVPVGSEGHKRNILDCVTPCMSSSSRFS